MLPSEIEINGLVWEVKKADVSHDEFGETRKEECQCVIGSRLVEQVAEQSFWHELIHMIWFSYGLDDDKLDEEQIAKLFGPALCAVLKQNAAITWSQTRSC